ncbi:uncharacterized protein isoform X2 [Rhodnius prolixus]
MAHKNNKLKQKNDGKQLGRLFSEPPTLSPFRATYFFCSNGCICPEDNDNTSLEVNKAVDFNIMRIISLNCWDSLLIPLEVYVTSGGCLSSMTFKALLHSVKTIEDLMICFRLIDILKIHNQHHPPCKKHKKEYYKNILLEPFNKTDGSVNYNFLYLIEDISNITEDLSKVETNSTKEDKVRVGPDKKSSKRDKGFKENFLEPNVMRTPQNRKSRLPLTVEDLESRINLYAKCGDFSSLPEFSLKDMKEDKSLENKAERVFIVFQLLLDILEQDLFIWLLKSRRNYGEKLNNPESWPLIANIVWKDLSNIGHVNDHCKEILFIFHKCPTKYKHALSRYLCLICEVIRVSEENKELKFPYFGAKCEEFCKTMATIISNNSSNEEIVKSIELIFPHWVKYIVLSYLLDSTLSSSSVYSLLSVLRILQRNLSKSDALSYSPIPKVNKRNRKNKANLRNHTGETKLHKLCRNNQFEKLEEIIKSPSTNVNIQDNYGWTPLHESAKYNAVDCLKLLLKYRLSPGSVGNDLIVNVRSSNGITPLMDAICAGNIFIIEELLKHGACSTIYNKSDSGQNALDMAEGNSDVKNLLLTSWNTCVSTYQFLNMKNHELVLFYNLLVSYCKTFPFKDKCLNQKSISCANNNDNVCGLDFLQKDSLYLNEIFQLLERLVNFSGTVSDHLRLTYIYLKLKLNC